MLDVPHPIAAILTRAAVRESRPKASENGNADEDVEPLLLFDRVRHQSCGVSKIGRDESGSNNNRKQTSKDQEAIYFLVTKAG